MTRSDLATVVLLQLECFWRLQEIDELLRQNDADTSALMDRLYSRRPVGWRELHPLVRMHTTLAHLVLPICFANSLTNQQLSGFSIKSEYDLVFRDNGAKTPPTVQAVLRVLRNALAHLPDFAAGSVSPNVSFEAGIVRFWTQPPTRGQNAKSRSAEVVFNTESGFVEFVRDLFGVVRAGCSPGAVAPGINTTQGVPDHPRPAATSPSRAESNWQQLLGEGWRMIQEFAPFDREEVAQLPTEIAALKLWAKAKLHEVEGVSPERQEWQAAVEMAIEAAYRVGRTDVAT